MTSKWVMRPYVIRRYPEVFGVLWADEVLRHNADYPWLSPNIIYHDVAQRSKTWLGLRKIVNGSQVGGDVGLSNYTSPAQSLREKLHPEEAEDLSTNVFCMHGTRLEPKSEKLFIEWRSSYSLHGIPECLKAHGDPTMGLAFFETRFGKYKKHPGYITPIETQHKFFNSEMDSEFFGASLDMEGHEGIPDCEIKNPYTIGSFRANYLHSIKPMNFCQVQWQMAMRERKYMYLFVTSYTNDPTLEPVLLGYVVWFVAFSQEFFDTMLYPKARYMAIQVTLGEEDPFIDTMIPWLNEDRAYEDSLEYKQLLQKCAVRLDFYEKK
jgi:hypothetical protein